jgi:cell pole-organizing protein PopZ
MEEILSSIKRVIEESEAAPAARPRRPAGKPQTAATGEEVLELSERVAFPAVERPAPTAAPAPSVDEPAAPAPATTGAAPRAESIISDNAAQASRGPLEALSRLIVKPDVAGSDTLEGLVREMLRPMLRDWLDTNLPGIVEAMVAKEIARISGRTL